MLSHEVINVFETRGWKSSAGSLYFNGIGTTAHPHLHLVIGRTMPRVNRDVRIAVQMLAWSDGGQDRGGGGRTFIADEQVRDNWNDQLRYCRTNASMARELLWIMDYFTKG
jgi:hypothetical protein